MQLQIKKHAKSMLKKIQLKVGIYTIQGLKTQKKFGCGII